MTPIAPGFNLLEQFTETELWKHLLTRLLLYYNPGTATWKRWTGVWGKGTELFSWSWPLSPNLHSFKTWKFSKPYPFRFLWMLIEAELIKSLAIVD